MKPLDSSTVSPVFRRRQGAWATQGTRERLPHPAQTRAFEESMSGPMCRMRQNFLARKSVVDPALTRGGRRTGDRLPKKPSRPCNLVFGVCCGLRARSDALTSQCLQFSGPLGSMGRAFRFDGPGWIRTSGLGIGFGAKTMQRVLPFQRFLAFELVGPARNGGWDRPLCLGCRICRPTAPHTRMRRTYGPTTDTLSHGNETQRWAEPRPQDKVRAVPSRPH